MSIAEHLKKKELVEKEIKKALAILAIEEDIMHQIALIKKKKGSLPNERLN